MSGPRTFWIGALLLVLPACAANGDPIDLGSGEGDLVIAAVFRSGEGRAERKSGAPIGIDDWGVMVTTSGEIGQLPFLGPYQVAEQPSWALIAAAPAWVGLLLYPGGL